MSDYQGTKVPIADFVAAVRNNSKNGQYVSASLMADALGISTMTVTRYARKWNKEHPEDQIEVARGLGFRMNYAPVVEPEEKENRYDHSKTEEGYSDPTAAAAMATEDNPIKDTTLWLTRESNGKFAYFAVLRVYGKLVVGYKFEKVEEHQFPDDFVAPYYIPSVGVMEKDLISDLARPTFKYRKYLIEKIRDLERDELRFMVRTLSKLFNCEYVLRQQLKDADRELSAYKKRDETAVEKKPEVQPSAYCSISETELAVLKKERDIYKTFFDRITSGKNANATIRVEEN